MKRIFWGIAGSAVILILIFYQTFFTQAAAWTLHAYTMSKWGKPLQYESISILGNKLVLHHPRFANETTFEAEHLSFGFQIDIWKPQVNISIAIDNPRWHFQSPLASQWESWTDFLSEEGKWIKTNPHVKIQEGLISWAVDDSPTKHVKFELEMNNHAGGYIKLCFDEKTNDRETLILQTSKLLNGVTVNFNFDKINCCSFASFAKFIGFDTSPWQISSGFLDGEITAIFPKNQRPWLEGTIIAKDINFQGFDSCLKGHIDCALLLLKKNQRQEEKGSQFPATIGTIELLEYASLVYESPNNEWAIKNLMGSIQLNEFETAIIKLQAKGGNTHYPSEWRLDGKAGLNANSSYVLDANLSCSAADQHDGNIHFVLQHPRNGFKHVEIQCYRLSYTECGFLQTLLSTHWPFLNTLLLQDGDFNAQIEANITQDGFGDLYVKQFEVNHLRSTVKPWNMVCDFGQVRGYGKVLLGSNNFLETLDTGLHFDDGRIEFEDLSPPMPLTDIQAHIFIKKGLVEHSLATLQVAGLKGIMDVEWGDYKQLLTFKLEGIAEDLSEIFPQALHEGLRKHFEHHRLMVLANLKRQNKKIELDGTVHIQRENTDLMDLIHFGCELKSNQDRDKVKYFPVGWFHAQHLPLTKYLSPFIFRNGVLQMSGEGEFKGTFDDKQLVIDYDAKNLKIENENLCIDIPYFHAQMPGQLMGTHRLDLHTYAYEGSFPLQSASYFEKNSGLVFQDIQGTVKLQNDFVRIQPIEAFCEGVYFNGELELDYKDPAPRVFDVSIHCPSLSGKISQIQHLLAHVGQSSFLHNIPLEGDINAKEDGLRLKFSFLPHDYNLQIDIKGTITDGAFPFQEADMTLKGIYMDVDYQHKNRQLEFTDIQGALLVGKLHKVEEYLFSGNHIRFNHMPQPDIDIDISVSDGENELLRIAGYTENESADVKNLHLNKSLSHFSCIYPHVWQCKLKDWWSIEQFEFRSQFDLNLFLQDLRRFRQTGFLFLSHSVIDRLSQYLPLEGKGFLTLRYLPDHSYAFQLDGLDIKQENSSVHNGLLKGSKQDKKWIIDQLQWDEWNVSAELHQMEDKWRIPYLALKTGEALLLGLEGDWLQDQALLKAKIKFCQVDLSKIERFQILQSFSAKWWPKGIINATGEMEWNLLASNPLEGFTAMLAAEGSELSFRDYAFNIPSTFQMKIRPFHYFRMENVQVELTPHRREAYIDLKHFGYHFSNDVVDSLEAAFHIPYHHLNRVGEAMHHHFPEILEQTAKEIFVASKQQDVLKGVLVFENRDANQNILKLDLEDGHYIFKGRDYDLKNFHVRAGGDEMQFSAHTHHERCPFQIAGQVLWPSCTQGLCKLTSERSSNPLTIKWENLPNEKLTIRSVQGDFCGCSFLLSENREACKNNGWIPLEGQITLDFNRLSLLLAPDTADAIRKLQVGAPYFLSGHFWINPDLGTFLSDTIAFKGNMIGHEAILKGYRMEKFQTDLQYVPGRLDIQNLSIQDSAGCIKAMTGMATRNPVEDTWDFFIPLLTVKNLKPGLLRDTDVHAQSNPKFQTLMIKKMDFENLQGGLSDIKSWQGQGHLHFVNPTRKNTTHNPLNSLLAIPAEIILRLGLNPHVLNPVTGTIYFNLCNEKFCLTRFKDVFSEGRGSRFYLAQKEEPSWMDMDGNLSVKIRMKQYNLIFKIAELFTVSVQGNIKKPVYRLQKHSKGPRKKPAIPIFR